MERRESYLPMSGSLEFNLPAQNYQPPEPPQLAYAQARKDWDDRIGSARVQAYNWRLFAFGVLLICLVETIGLIYQGSQNKITPYVVQVGSDGAVQAIGPAIQANTLPQDTQIKYFLAQFVARLRTIPLDPVVAKQNWLTAYAFLRPAAGVKMNALFQTENPATRPGNETVQIQMNVVVPISPDTYQLRWKEDTYDKSGVLQSTAYMTGSFTVDFTPPTTEKEIMVNPLGLYIKDFYWSHDLQGGR
jgi:type IV secretion system protein VirB5